MMDIFRPVTDVFFVMIDIFSFMSDKFFSMLDKNFPMLDRSSKMSDSPMRCWTIFFRYEPIRLKCWTVRPESQKECRTFYPICRTNGIVV
ncbi:MAG: hypothetical protein C6W56_01440 [Caldibacillus debilis]|nr:MAG: hypothetical protein C6W56_01440 [Caldibacillus debilis]